MYTKLQSIKNSLPKNDLRETTVNSFIKNLDDKYNDPKLFDQNVDKEITDLKDKIIEIINVISNKFRNKTDIDKEIQNQTENIKTIINTYDNDFGIIFLFKVFKAIEEEIKSTFNKDTKIYILNAIKKLYIQEK